jgi:hypothetical protein
MQAVNRILVTSLLLLFAPASFAALSVDSLNFPVWVERGEQSMPAAPGDKLLAGDVIRTGQAGRAWLALEDGSVIKLGEATRFVVERAEFRQVDGTTLLDGAFDVLKGAFRFTSNFFTAIRPAQHRVKFQVGAVTVGVRGTDIWGLSSDSEDFVALIEGSIEATSNGDTPQLMEQTLTLYRKPAAAPANPVQPVEMSVVQQLAPKTELQAEAGIARVGGGYSLVFASVQAKANAEALVERLRRAGYPVSTRAVDVEGRNFTRVQLNWLVDLESARKLRERMIREAIVDDAWISSDR